MHIMDSKMDGRKRLFVQKTQLIKDHGWTRSLINRFLPEPDKLARNRHNKHRKTCLYKRERVWMIQETDEFCKAFAETEKRRDAIAQATLARNQKLEAMASNSVIHVQFVERYDLVYDAIEYCEYSIKRARGWDGFEIISGGLCNGKYSEYKLDSYVVHYIFHKLTTIFGEVKPLQLVRIRSRKLPDRMKEKALEEIARVYPWLSEECNRRIEEIYEESTNSWDVASA
jgi:hypothetical protein